MSLSRESAAKDLRRARTRITAVTLVCLVAVLAVAGFVLLRVHERGLVDGIDERMRQDAERAGLVGEGGGIILVPPSTITHDIRVQLLDADGQLIYATEAVKGEAPLWQPGQPVAATTVEQPGKGRLRVVPARFRTGWVVLAEPLQPVDDAVATLRTTLLASAVPLALALGFVVWLAVGRALRPVRAARDREEQLVADVSHELRSPIAGMRVLLETQPTDPIGIELTRHEALGALGRLESVTDQLLVLGNHDRAPAPAARRPIDLDEVVEDHTRQLALRTDVTIDTKGVVAGQVVGDPTGMASMVENLLTNAVRHGHRRVVVSLTEHDGTVELVVEDDGPGISPDQRAVVFERFARLDEARTRDEGGAGLGLAIARAVVQAHGGTIGIGDSWLGGARFVVRLPASTDSTPSDPPRPHPRADDPPRSPVTIPGSPQRAQSR